MILVFITRARWSARWHESSRIPYVCCCCCVFVCARALWTSRTCFRL